MRVVTSTLLVTFVLGAAASAQQPDQKPSVRCLVGLESIKRNATGLLTVQNGALLFKDKKGEAQVPVTNIDDIFVGSEVSQGHGTTGKILKTASMAAPYGSGRVMTLVLRTKFDVLTVAYHEPGGALHAAIFTLPKGLAQPLRDQMVQAGAHASPQPPPEAEQKEAKQ